MTYRLKIRDVYRPLRQQESKNKLPPQSFGRDWGGFACTDSAIRKPQSSQKDGAPSGRVALRRAPADGLPA